MRPATLNQTAFRRPLHGDSATRTFFFFSEGFSLFFSPLAFFSLGATTESLLIPLQDLSPPRFLTFGLTDPLDDDTLEVFAEYDATNALTP